MVVKINELVKADAASGLTGLIVLVMGKEKKDAIEKIASEHGITVPLVLPATGDAAVKYKINADARNTFMVAKLNTVTFNAVNVTPETFDGVAKAVADMLGK